MYDDEVKNIERRIVVELEDGGTSVFRFKYIDLPEKTKVELSDIAFVPHCQSRFLYFGSTSLLLLSQTKER